MSLATMKLYVSRYVIFHETIFPFAMKKDPTHFPSFTIHVHCLVDQFAYATSDLSFDSTVQYDPDISSETNPFLSPNLSIPQHHLSPSKQQLSRPF